QEGKTWDGTTGSYKSYTYTINGATHSVGDQSDPNEAIVQGTKYAFRVSAKDTSNPSYGSTSTVIYGLTTDQTASPGVTNILVSPCDGTNNCSTKGDISHKGFETKITWDPSIDAGVGTSHYLVYRSTDNITISNYNDSNIRNSYKIAGVLPYQPAQTIEWYDNDSNNDNTTIFYRQDGSSFNISSEIQALTDKLDTGPSNKLNDYTIYYYRIVAVDLNNNKSLTFPEINLSEGTYDIAKAYQNGNTGQELERTPDITSPTVPTGVNATAGGIDPALNPDSPPNNPVQMIDVGWNFSPDPKASSRVPTGEGSGISQYKLYISSAYDPVTTDPTTFTPDLSDFTLKDTVSYTETTKHLTALGEYKLYWFKVEAIDNQNNISAKSSPGYTRTFRNSQPTAPKNALGDYTYATVVSTIGDPNTTNSSVGSQVTLTFKGSYSKYAQIVKYYIYRSTVKTGTVTDSVWEQGSTLVDEMDITPIQNDTINTRTFVDSNLDDSTTYYYRIKALDNTPTLEGGPFLSNLTGLTEGTLHAGWDITPDNTEPSTPSDVKVKDIHPNDSMVRNIITWAMISVPQRSNTDDFGKYQVWRYETSQGIVTASVITEKTDRGDNYHVDGIPDSEKDKDYSYFVVAVDNAGTEFKYSLGTVINSYSNVSDHLTPVSINPGVAKPTVSNVDSSNVGVSSATIIWATDQNTDSLVEYRPKETNKVSGVLENRTEMTTSHSIILNALQKGTTYQYRIVSRNSLGNIDELAANTWKEFTTQDFSISGDS
ncbi:hypothetical protein CO152_03675, partial [bacterium CG_4_9_14_3_um_filter_33_26]